MTINTIYPSPARGATGSLISGQTLTVSSTAVQFATVYDPRDVKLVAVDVKTDNVYATFDGSTPTSTNGFELAAGTNYTWPLGLFQNAKFIRKTNDASMYASPLSN